MSTSDDEVVERFLRFLRDPMTLVDPAKVATSEQSLAAASSEVERLFALRDLREAKSPDATAIVADFRRVFPQWLKAHRLTAEDLKACGLSVAEYLPRAHNSLPRAKRSRPSGRPIDSLVIGDRAVAAIAERGALTTKEIAVALGVSASTAAKVAKRLSEAGRLSLDQVRGVGRPANRFSVV